MTTDEVMRSTSFALGAHPSQIASWVEDEFLVVVSFESETNEPKRFHLAAKKRDTANTAYPWTGPYTEREVAQQAQRIWDMANERLLI